MVQFLDERIYKTDTSIITGVEPFPDLSGEIRVYPNPVIKGDEVVIDLTDTDFNRELSVYDYAGKKIYSTFIVRNTFKIIAPDKPGIYFLVINNKHSKSTRRLIVH